MFLPWNTRAAILSEGHELPAPSQDIRGTTKELSRLAIGLAEYGTCYRHEKSGELFGLMRVRMLEMNDATILHGGNIRR